jgi:hypothetical protein
MAYRKIFLYINNKAGGLFKKKIISNKNKMGLKKFLQQQGFIEAETGDQGKVRSDKPGVAPQTTSDVPQPVYFPLSSSSPETGSLASSGTMPSDPSFVAPLQQNTKGRASLDPTFIKFFEEEMVKANLPGPDYFEFRQMLLKTQQKMTSKGVAAPEVVLQAVLMSFEAQDIQSEKLIQAARHYKETLTEKKDDFIKGAEAEKNNQLQKRQNVLKAHDDNIRKIEQQLQQLELQKKQLDEAMSKEKTQMEVDKTLGKEGIEKIERAEQLISLAHDYIQTSIDADIKRLQSA